MFAFFWPQLIRSDVSEGLRINLSRCSRRRERPNLLALTVATVYRYGNDAIHLSLWPMPMNLSRRMQNINQGGGDGWEVHYRSRALASEGEDILDLTIGDHDFRTAAVIIDSMSRSARAGNTGYSPVKGSMALRRAIAARIEQDSGITTESHNVLVTAGGQAALFAAHMAVLDENDTGLYIDPCYATFPGTIRASGAAARAIPTRSEDGFLPNAADIAGSIDETTRSLLINTPNNPTGAVYSAATLAEIGRVCHDNDLWLISDEVYDTQVWTGRHVSPRSVRCLADRTLVVGSFSKSYAMTGFRCGWLVGPKSVIAAMAELSTVSTFGVPGFIQDAALYALTQGETIKRHLARIYRNRHLVAKKALDGTNSVQAMPPQGAMYLFLDVRSTGLTGIEFANRLLAEHRISVMPGESFGSAASGFVRVALTTSAERLVTALQGVAAFAARLARN